MVRDPKGRGSSPTGHSKVPPTPASRYRRAYAGDEPRADFRWEHVEREFPGIIADLVCAITGAGDAIQLSRSRDGGAVGIRVYDGGTPKTVWSNTPAEAVEVLKDYIADAKAASGDL